MTTAICSDMKSRFIDRVSRQQKCENKYNNHNVTKAIMLVDKDKQCYILIFCYESKITY